MQTVGELIKYRRDALRLTRKDLSARLATYGVEYSVSAIAWWEGNRTNPPMHDRHFIEAMAKSLEMTIADFLSFLGLVDEDLGLSDDEKSLLEAYRSGNLQQAMRILSDSTIRKSS